MADKDKKTMKKTVSKTDLHTSGKTAGGAGKGTVYGDVPFPHRYGCRSEIGSVSGNVRGTLNR